MNNAPVFKRKKVFIQPAFQSRFIFWIVVVVILASILSAILLYFLLTSFYASQAQSAHIILAESWQRLGLTIAMGNLIALLLGSVVAAFIVLHRSHKIAGPLYRFCQIFEQIGKGQLKDMMHLRKNDELSEVADSIQNMIDGLKQQRQHRQQTLQTMLNTLEQLEEKELSGENMLSAVQRLKQNINQLLVLELKQ